jgi:hypothetical protein
VVAADIRDADNASMPRSPLCTTMFPTRVTETMATSKPSSSEPDRTVAADDAWVQWLGRLGRDVVRVLTSANDDVPDQGVATVAAEVDPVLSRGLDPVVRDDVIRPAFKRDPDATLVAASDRRDEIAGDTVGTSREDDPVAVANDFIVADGRRRRL